MYLVSSYLIVFISLFSSFINVNVGGLTSNPILLLTSLLITLNKIKFHLINKKIIPLLIINLLSTIFVYFNDGKGFDFFFVFIFV